MPPPEPRSSTTSPSLSSASAVGLPQPSEAITASTGSVPICSASYRFDVIGSPQPRTAATARILVALAHAPGGLAVFLLHDVSNAVLSLTLSIA